MDVLYIIQIFGIFVNTLQLKNPADVPPSDVVIETITNKCLSRAAGEQMTRAASLAYYYDHKEEIDRSIEQGEAFADALHQIEFLYRNVIFLALAAACSSVTG